MYSILLFGVKEKSCDIKIIPFLKDVWVTQSRH